jgi:putative transposase
MTEAGKAFKSALLLPIQMTSFMEREYAGLRIFVQDDSVWLGTRDASKWLSVEALLLPFGRSCSLGRQRCIELNPVRTEMVEDPAHYRWTSYCANGLGQVDARLTQHALYQALGRSDKERQANYRALFRAQLDRAAVDDIRLAFNQSQPPGNMRFFGKIERMTGQKREARPRDGPREESKRNGAALLRQTRLHFSE